MQKSNSAEVQKSKCSGGSCARPSFDDLIFKSSEDKPSSDIKIKAEKKFFPGEEHFIVCKNCGNNITSPENIIAVNGEHLHAYTNPDGYEYEFGCFSLAEGCIIYGEPTLEHTWFEGFTWNLCMCSNCLIHNGWFYERNEESFFGLILDLIVDTTTTH